MKRDTYGNIPSFSNIGEIKEIYMVKSFYKGAMKKITWNLIYIIVNGINGSKISS